MTDTNANREWTAADLLNPNINPNQCLPGDRRHRHKCKVLVPYYLAEICKHCENRNVGPPMRAGHELLPRPGSWTAHGTDSPPICSVCGPLRLKRKVIRNYPYCFFCGGPYPGYMDDEKDTLDWWVLEALQEAQAGEEDDEEVVKEEKEDKEETVEKEKKKTKP